MTETTLSGRWRLAGDATRPMLLLSVLALGCTVAKFEREIEAPVERTVRTLAIGPIITDRPEWEPKLLIFRTELVERLRESEAFDDVLFVPDSPTTSVPVLSGRITRIDSGNRSHRAVVGLGAGRSVVSGDFEVRDVAGRVLLGFESRQEYYGGFGPGGVLAMGAANLVSLDQLMEKLGRSTAKKIATWAREQAPTP